MGAQRTCGWGRPRELQGDTLRFELHHLQEPTQARACPLEPFAMESFRADVEAQGAYGQSR